jgi:hypothetical protein
MPAQSAKRLTRQPLGGMNYIIYTSETVQRKGHSPDLEFYDSEI